MWCILLRFWIICQTSSEKSDLKNQPQSIISTLARHILSPAPKFINGPLFPSLQRLFVGYFQEKRQDSLEWFMFVCLGVKSWPTAPPKPVSLVDSNSYTDARTVIWRNRYSVHRMHSEVNSTPSHPHPPSHGDRLAREQSRLSHHKIS